MAAKKKTAAKRAAPKRKLINTRTNKLSFAATRAARRSRK